MGTLREVNIKYDMPAAGQAVKRTTFEIENARRLGLDGHIGEHLLHHLDVDEAPPELLALLGVGHGLVERSLHECS